jgi:hypothetical protein
MDYSSLIITVAILIYGLFEYRRREQRHRIDMEFLRRGITPPQESELVVPRWRIATVAMTAFFTFATAGILIFKGITHPGYRTPLFVIACVFLALSAPLVYMIVRDRRAPRGKLRRSI